MARLVQTDQRRGLRMSEESLGLHAPPPLPSAERSDAGLLAEIAQRRDAEAFTELFKRHEHAAYSLALHITGQRDLSEEAVQEASLRIWQTAGRFQALGTVRSWLLSIVAGKSLEILRARRAGKRVKESGSLAGLVSETVRPEENLEKNESLKALRIALGGLPQLEKQLLALHFGGGLSHEEIGAALAMPRRTISYKLEQTVKTLRTQLAQAGFGAAAPLLGAAGLHQALTSGAQAPASLRERVSEGLTQAARESLRAGRLGAAKGAWSTWALPLAGLTLAAAVAVASWWAGANLETRKTAALEPAVPPQALPAPPAQTPPRAERFVRHWDFNTPEQAQDFKVTRGSWHHVPGGGPDGSGCMESESPDFDARLDIPAGSLPLRISFRKQPLPVTPGERFKAGVLWEGFSEAAEFKNVGKVAQFTQGAWTNTQVFLTARCSDIYTAGKRVSLVAYFQAKGDRLRLTLSGRHRVDDLRVETVSPEEVPDVRAYLEALDRIEASRRNQELVLPQFTSPQEGKKVTVVFYSATEERK